MNSNKKRKPSPKLDAEEIEIEDNLNISKRLSPKKKAQELAKLKAAAKDHAKKNMTYPTKRTEKK